MSKLSDDAAKLFRYVMMFLVAVVLPPLTFGWVLSILWGWFISSQFGLPAISVVQAMGITILVRLLTATTAMNHTTGTSGKLFSYSIVFPLAGLCFGWVIHKFL